MLKDFLSTYLRIFLLVIIIPAGNVCAQSELWGLTSIGGENNGGTIFKVDYNGLNHKVVHSFELEYMGKSPVGSPIEASNGKYYGLTAYGGTGSANGLGVLFEYDPITNGYTVIVSFDGVGNGMVPFGYNLINSLPLTNFIFISGRFIFETII